MANTTSNGIWIKFLDEDRGLSREVLAAAVVRAGLVALALDPDQPRGPGLVVFAEVTPRLCEFVHAASRNGLERVLALAVGRPALADGDAWRLLGAGAGDVFAWDHSADPAAEVAARFTRWQAVDDLVRSPFVRSELVGQSSAWVAALRQLVEVARFTDASVLITGESGTGKELAARLIHTLDARPGKHDLVVLDCTTVVPELSGSEFFGHERGAFTGAVAARDGAFALADGGTLFLDEVGELPLTLQAELLRVVQERTYKRVGSSTWQQTAFRLVCATNRDLRQEEAQGRFRRDFYYRIATWSCHLPPLRERHEDILPLASHFLRQLRPGQEPPPLDEAVRGYLLRRAYPGNVRDLKQLVARMGQRHVGPGPITTGDIPVEERPPADAAPADWYGDPLECAVRRALAHGVGLKEIGRAAEDLAVHRLAVECQAVMMVILIGPADDGEPVLLVLDVAPQQVAEWPQGVDVEAGQRVRVAGATLVLEAQVDGVQALDQHPLLVPVRPDQLEQARAGELGDQDAVAVGRDAVLGLERHARQVFPNPPEVGEHLRVHVLVLQRLEVLVPEDVDLFQRDAPAEPALLVVLFEQQVRRIAAPAKVVVRSNVDAALLHKEQLGGHLEQVVVLHPVKWQARLEVPARRAAWFGQLRWR